MSAVYAFGDVVVCEPFESRAPEVKKVGVGQKQFEGIVSKELLVPLKVIFPSSKHNLKTGDEVFVAHADSSSTEWGKKTYFVTLDGQERKIVLVPSVAIKLVRG